MSKVAETGFTIPYSVRQTLDKGRGVFADHEIPKGSTVWHHVTGQFVIYTEETIKPLLDRLSHNEIIYELTHMYGLNEFPEYLIRIIDDGVLINHSEQPSLATNNLTKTFQHTNIRSSKDVANALLSDRFSVIALRDIEKGEELTLNYNSDVVDPEYYNALCEQYDISWEWME